LWHLHALTLWFLLFLLLNAVLMTYGVWAAAAVCWHDVVRLALRSAHFWQGGEKVAADAWLVFSYLLGTRTEVVMVGIICAVMGAIVWAFLLYHLALAVANQTTNETFKWGDLAFRRDHLLAHFATATKEAAAERARGAAAAARGDAAGAAAAEARAAALLTARGADGAPRALAAPGPMPRNAYDRGWRANLAEVAWPLSARAGGRKTE